MGQKEAAPIARRTAEVGAQKGLNQFPRGLLRPPSFVAADRLAIHARQALDLSLAAPLAHQRFHGNSQMHGFKTFNCRPRA